MQILSAAAFSSAEERALTTAAGRSLVQALADRACNVGIVPRPMPSAGFIENGWNLDATRDFATVSTMFGDGLDRFAEELGVRAFLQPDDTLLTPLSSRPKYAKGSVGLRGNAHKDGDATHMNAHYGQRVIEAYFLLR